MDFERFKEHEKLHFGEMRPGTFLLGLLSSFENKYQASADHFFKDITWKQMFAAVCTQLFKESPTISELAEVIGSSRQNVKQILLKLERKGFVEFAADKEDRRIQRVVLTEKYHQYFKERDGQMDEIYMKLFEGISDEKLLSTIETLLRMERNLENV